MGFATLYPSYEFSTRHACPWPCVRATCQTFSPSPEFVNQCRVGCAPGLRSAAYGHDGDSFEHAGDAVGQHAATDPDFHHQAKRGRLEVRGPDPAWYGQPRPRRWRQPQYRGLRESPQLLPDPHGEEARSAVSGRSFASPGEPYGPARAIHPSRRRCAAPQDEVYHLRSGRERAPPTFGPLKPRLCRLHRGLDQLDRVVAGPFSGTGQIGDFAALAIHEY